MELIFAEATPPGRGGVSVIRLSGTDARVVAERLVGPMARARHAYFRDLAHEGEVIDQVLAIWFEAGASFTGEEVAELHLHGAPIIVRRVSEILSGLGARPAVAGEFTRRSFLNGRMGLAEIEGLGDLLAAETEAQRKLALRTARGELGQKAGAWRAMLVEAGALVEVSVDFADEDVPEEIPSKVFDLTAALKAELERELAGFRAAERVRLGFEVAIIGPPNAGKSSLLNALARRDLAIVSSIAGTTRDVIELRYDLNGLPVVFLDTAGIHEAGDEVEAIGISRALTRAEEADLRIHLSTAGEAVAGLYVDGDIVVRSQADRAPGLGSELAVSTVLGEGIEELLRRVADIVSSRTMEAGVISHERQRYELATAADALVGLEALPVEIVAERIRAAGFSLDRLIGKVGSEDYLDVIFSSFCIGK
ncbi:tRNA uridine-5-carboxymethylaminomethyl(34) synthesis GTPase MnmE [Paracoccus aestuarii]|uniref:tRNA modification GTPase MnmE n=1 Tax=Paracoccus aestuarii TaxID=453842 RepID=A0A418ZX26_9RHOB|nr:tRNA uridine-5-carboxymethylaminomethyl(34) synthesis GTPase MnmE [Paracoccus aestuarii]RJL05035.1 tRNA uridine-5-carboxymethylaminomethyl(34) synthesis GTPase MnmE [Paracoccus aestuarii]WCQ99241.1 tRNA uridine-5-carboxymethylaminomethyl(34) synthesis GTPase MnmE [Paracoccus aestuarii]